MSPLWPLTTTLVNPDTSSLQGSPPRVMTPCDNSTQRIVPNSCVETLLLEHSPTPEDKSSLVGNLAGPAETTRKLCVGMKRARELFPIFIAYNRIEQYQQGHHTHRCFEITSDVTEEFGCLWMLQITLPQFRSLSRPRDHEHRPSLHDATVCGRVSTEALGALGSRAQ